MLKTLPYEHHRIINISLVYGRLCHTYDGVWSTCEGCDRPACLCATCIMVQSFSFISNAQKDFCACYGRLGCNLSLGWDAKFTKKNCPPVTTVLPRNEQSKLQAPFFPEGIEKLSGAGSAVSYTPAAGCWSSWTRIQLASSLQSLISSLQLKLNLMAACQ